MGSNTDLRNAINDLKKSRRRLKIAISMSLALGLILVSYFILSFTPYGFTEAHILLKLFWLSASAINFYSVYNGGKVLRSSKESIEESEEALMKIDEICNKISDYEEYYKC